MPKISALPPAGSLADDDETPFVDDSTSSTKKFTLSGLKAWLQSLAGWISTAMLADDAVTPAKLSLVNYQTDNSNTIASFTDGNITFQCGWGQQVGDNVNTYFEVGVTLPVAFTTILGVSAAALPVKTSAATSITDFNVDYTTVMANALVAAPITNSGFNILMQRASGAFSNTTYYGYSWIAWGIL